MTRVFSGIQPTGDLHLGNYLGAIRNWVEDQHRADSFYCVVDLHALTVPKEPGEVRDKTVELAQVLLACGLDPEVCTLFVQSQVPEHTELAWILDCFTQMGELAKMTQFKDKARQHKEILNAGLFTYPVLQAADILLYLAEEVPVGEDQIQHLELCRDIAGRFNQRYGPTFPLPATVLSEAPRVLGTDGEQKMSKSKGNELGLLDPPQALEAKLRGAKTDPARLRRRDPGEPTRCNVFTWHGFFTPQAERDACAAGCRSAGIGCIDCKAVLLKHLEAVLAPMRERHAALLALGPDHIDRVLAAGAERARRIARETMAVVRERLGLRPRPGGER